MSFTRELCYDGEEGGDGSPEATTDHGGEERLRRGQWEQFLGVSSKFLLCKNCVQHTSFKEKWIIKVLQNFSSCFLGLSLADQNVTPGRVEVSGKPSKEAAVRQDQGRAGK